MNEKEESIIINYFTKYKIKDDNINNSENIKSLITLIIKDINNDCSKKKEELEIILKELFKNNYWCDKDYEFKKYLKYNDNFILKNINISNLLFYSIEFNNFNIAKLLLKCGAKLNDINKNIIHYLFKNKSLDSKKFSFALNIVKDASILKKETIFSIIEKKKL